MGDTTVCRSSMAMTEQMSSKVSNVFGDKMRLSKFVVTFSTSKLPDKFK